MNKKELKILDHNLKCVNKYPITEDPKIIASYLITFIGGSGINDKEKEQGIIELAEENNKDVDKKSFLSGFQEGVDSILVFLTPLLALMHRDGNSSALDIAATFIDDKKKCKDGDCLICEVRKGFEEFVKRFPKKDDATPST